MSGSIQRIGFIGSGNVASHLAAELMRKGKEIVCVYSANFSHARLFSSKYHCPSVEYLKDLAAFKADLIVIAITDDQLRNLTENLPKMDAIFAHTSGFNPINMLGRVKKYGVFYPLQTFTRQIEEVNWNEIPICIEASDAVVESKLVGFAKELSKNVLLLSSEKRKVLHLAAVLVSNFSNLLYSQAFELMEENKIHVELLLPLINETARKVNKVSPDEAQTGPARRNDRLTLAEHLKMLEDFPDIRQVYQTMSDQIIKKYHE